MKDLTLKPRVSEKSYGLSQTRTTYVFDVPQTANKISVKKAVQAQYDVTVEDVNIALIKGKQKRTMRKNGRSVSGSRNDIKKAYVRLTAGQTLPVFAAVDEAAAEQQKASKKEKK